MYRQLMNKLYSNILCLLTFMLACTPSFPEFIEIGDEGSKFIIEKNVTENSSSLNTTIKLPSFEKGTYYRPYSGGVAAGNRVEAVAFNSLEELQAYKPPITRKGHGSVQNGQYILLKIKEDKYLSLLPMVSERSYANFFIQNNQLILKSDNFGKAKMTGDIPMLIWSYGTSPYEATHKVWDIALSSGYISADWRQHKNFPEMYNYIGWCSWEHYKSHISEKIITDAAHTLENSNAPFRWLLVDDGYLTANKKRSIISFEPDKKKFPNGWKPVTDLKNPDKLKWIGVWRNTLGYMTAIAPEHSMKDLKNHLIRNNNYMLPDGTEEGARLFYEKMVGDSKKNGFDFTKVDFQYKAFVLYKNTENPVLSMRRNNDALENACKKFDTPLLNCIAQPNINAMQTKYSALTRSSPDYNQSDKNKNKCNAYQSFANHLWMGQTVWGDLDMFHTHDERDVQPMSIARAISGGPVYISDEPSKIVPEVLFPFCNLEGKVFRAKAPATLLPESFFIHPFRDENVFRVVAPLENEVAAVALFNFSEADKTLSSFVSASDYPYAGEQLQPYQGKWKLPKDGLLLYDQIEKKVLDLDDTFTTEIESFKAKLFLLYPKTEGWAVIGRTDKYLPASTVKIKSISSKKISCTMMESGPLTVWSESGKPKIKGAKFKSLGDNLYVADMKVQKGEKEITITR